MIHVFSALCATPLFAQYLQFRHIIFNQHLRYHESGFPVYHFPADGAPDGFEFDLYDQPKALHLAWVGQDGAYAGRILGCFRLLPADTAYMVRDSVLQKIWPDVHLHQDLPQNRRTYEGSRVAVAPDIPRAMRQQVLDELILATYELAQLIGYSHVIGIMTHAVWKSVYLKRGANVTFLSNAFSIGSDTQILIGLIDMSSAAYANVRSTLQGEQFAPLQIKPELLAWHRRHIACAE